jgi:hypothetical protein
MPETPETHKEIVEIKREVQEIRQAQDAEFYQSRHKWEDHLISTIGTNPILMKVLLAVDGINSAKELEKECGLYQVQCWRALDKLQRDGLIFKLEDTKKGSPIYAKSRWFTVLRLDDLVQRKLEGLTGRTETLDAAEAQQENRQDNASSQQ